MLNNRLHSEVKENNPEKDYCQAVSLQVRSLYSGVIPFANVTALETNVSPLLVSTAKNLGLDTTTICDSFVDIYTNPLFNNYYLKKEDNKNTTIHAFLNDYYAKISAILNTDLNEKNLKNIVFIRDHIHGLISQNEMYMSVEDQIIAANKLRNKVNRTIINTNNQLGNGKQNEALPLIADVRNPDTEIIWKGFYGNAAPIADSMANTNNFESLIKKLTIAKKYVNLPSDELPLDATALEFDELFVKKDLKEEEVKSFVASVKSCRRFNSKLSEGLQQAYDKIKAKKQSAAREVENQVGVNDREELRKTSITSFIKKIFSRN